VIIPDQPVLVRAAPILSPVASAIPKPIRVFEMPEYFMEEFNISYEQNHLFLHHIVVFADM
jgi:hypothetical protein